MTLKELNDSIFNGGRYEDKFNNYKIDITMHDEYGHEYGVEIKSIKINNKLKLIELNDK